MPRILVTPPLFTSGQGPWRAVLEAAGAEIVLTPVDATRMSADELVKLLDGVEGVIAGIELYSSEVLSRARTLRAIARAGVGYDSVDVGSATEHGIAVCITPGTNEHSVAEQALALVFAVFRDIARRDQEIRAGQWRRTPVRRLAGNTLGLLGLGRIGRAMAPRARGLGLNVIAHDPFADKAYAAEQGVRLCSLEELLGEADIVSLHMPCTAETTNLINARTLALMKPTAVLVNTSRGGLVDEAALHAALTSGRIAAAGLDVLKVEPPPVDHPLLKLPNVVLAPHLGGIDQTALDAMGALAAECLVKLSRGQWPDGCVVNEQLRAGWTW